MKSPPKDKKVVSLKDTKRALKICHIADVHLGFRRYNRLTKHGQNQREADVNLSFREAISKIISLKPDITIIAGDLFHHVRPTNTIITYCFREIKRLSQSTKAPIVIIGGNHEFPRRQDTGSALKILSEIENVHTSDHSADKFTFPSLGLSVTCLSHAALLNEPNTAVRADDNYEHNILVMHGQIGKDIVSDFGGVEVDLKSFSQHEWDYIALGHLHDMREVGLNAAYSGSVEHTANNIWGELRKEKGFLEIRLPSGEKLFHPLTSPREVKLLPPIDAYNLEAAEVLEVIENSLEEIRGGIEGKIIRLEVNNIPREVQMALNHKKIRELRSRCLNLTLELRPPPSKYNLVNLGVEKTKKLDEHLSDYCDSLEGNLSNNDEIKGLLLSYLEKVEATHEITKLEP